MWCCKLAINQWCHRSVMTYPSYGQLYRLLKFLIKLMIKKTTKFRATGLLYHQAPVIRQVLPCHDVVMLSQDMRCCELKIKYRLLGVNEHWFQKWNFSQDNNNVLNKNDCMRHNFVHGCGLKQMSDIGICRLTRSLSWLSTPMSSCMTVSGYLQNNIIITTINGFEYVFIRWIKWPIRLDHDHYYHKYRYHYCYHYHYHQHHHQHFHCHHHYHYHHYHIIMIVVIVIIIIINIIINSSSLSL